MKSHPFTEPVYENIPESLRALDQWILWRADWKAKTASWSKVPARVSDPSRNASSTDSKTWTDYGTARAACEESHPERCAGLGFVFTADDAFVGVDLDDARNPETGEPLEWALHILKKFAGTYCEVSPSQTGYKLWARGAKHWDGKQTKCGAGAVEVYDRGRYFTVTGERFGDAVEVTDQQEALDWLGETVFGGGKARDSEPVRLSREQEAVIAAADESDKPRDRQTVIDAMWRLSESRAASYDDWLRIGMACHSADSSELMLIEWTRWSRTCPEKYDPAACREKWQSFSRKPGGVGVGTLVAMAREDVESADREDKLALLRERLQLPTLERVIRWTGATVAFDVELADGKRIELGTAKQILSVAHVRGVLFGEMGTLIAMDKRGWPDIALALSDVAESREGAERNPILEWLADFEANNQSRFIRGPKEATVVGSFDWYKWILEYGDRGGFNFRCEDGVLHFSLVDFQRWVFYQLFERITRAELVTALRRAGAEPVTIDKRRGAERFQVRLWRVPTLFRADPTGVEPYRSSSPTPSYTENGSSVGEETPF